MDAIIKDLFDDPLVGLLIILFLLLSTGGLGYMIYGAWKNRNKPLWNKESGNLIKGVVIGLIIFFVFHRLFS